MENQSVVNHTSFKLGTIGHLKHYESEFARVKKLAENATGKLADKLYLELDGITMILEDYLP